MESLLDLLIKCQSIIVLTAKEDMNQICYHPYSIEVNTCIKTVINGVKTRIIC